MKHYSVRPATLDDADILVRHRLGMFTDMGVQVEPRVADAFRTWLAEMMPHGAYRAWLLESDQGEVVAGGGITVLPWPPGPRSTHGRLAYVYNVYTEPTHRRHGHARLIMSAIHAWCRETGVHMLALNTSQFGQALYASMGYQHAPSPMMFLGLE
jgi:GNAT superfamily N-acetyltransferase